MELNIYFKNVGQGDTLLFDWVESNVERKYALIDCNLFDEDITPLILHIEKFRISEFEFVMMTHPHSDHFSGFLKFLSHCEHNNIFIKKFIHTASFDPTYIASLVNKQSLTTREFRDEVTLSVNRRKHKKALWTLFQFLKKQHKLVNGFIGAVKVRCADHEISLTDEVKIKMLAPESIDDMGKYFTSTYNSSDREKIKISQKLENNPHANYLATLLVVYNDKRNWQVILSSDVTKFTLKHIMEDEIFESIRKRKLIAAQIPHHGSAKNHIPEFWSGLTGINDSHILISAGEGYGHPDSEVVRYFAQCSKQIHCTNFVGGFKKYFKSYNSNTKSVYPSWIFKLPGINPLSKKKNQAPPAGMACGEKCLYINDEDKEVDCQVVDCL